MAATTVSDFIRKLSCMLDEDRSGVVSWGASGDTFVITEPIKFSTTLLPAYFKHQNFASFVRQLNKYDFHKVKAAEEKYGKEAWEFQHPQFLYGRKDLLEKIKRKSVPPKKSSRSYEDQTTPPSTFESDNVPLLSERPLDSSSMEYVLQENSKLSAQVALLEKSLSSLTTQVHHIATQMTQVQSDFTQYKQWAESQTLLSCRLVEAVMESKHPTDKLKAAAVSLDRCLQVVRQSKPISDTPVPSYPSPSYSHSAWSNNDQQSSMQLMTRPPIIEPVGQMENDDARPLVLVVDDDKGYRDIVQKLLSKLGYKVELAANGLNALNAFGLSIQSGNKYQAVLMDVCMPLMDGIEATGRIRKMDQSIPIICVTSNTSPIDKDMYLGSGMNAVLHKPVRKDSLQSIMSSFFNMAQGSAYKPSPHFPLLSQPTSTLFTLSHLFSSHPHPARIQQVTSHQDKGKQRQELDDITLDAPLSSSCASVLDSYHPSPSRYTEKPVPYTDYISPFSLEGPHRMSDMAMSDPKAKRLKYSPS